MTLETILKSKCPDCNMNLIFDPGTWGSFEEPAEPATIFCPRCGYDRPPEKKDWQEVEEYEREQAKRKWAELQQSRG